MLDVRLKNMPDAEPTETPPARGSRRQKRWIWRIGLGVLLLVVALSFQSLITVYCWLTETPRSQFRLSSEMRAPIRTLFRNWTSSESSSDASSVQALTELIGNELPKGSTLADVNEHIHRHYREGAIISKPWGSRSNAKGSYIFPWCDVKQVKACWNPRDFLEGGSVKVSYVTLEGVYLRTEIKFVGWKGHTDSDRTVRIIAVEDSGRKLESESDLPLFIRRESTKEARLRMLNMDQHRSALTDEEYGAMVALIEGADYEPENDPQGEQDADDQLPARPESNAK